MKVVVTILSSAMRRCKTTVSVETKFSVMYGWIVQPAYFYYIQRVFDLGLMSTNGRHESLYTVRKKMKSYILPTRWPLNPYKWHTFQNLTFLQIQPFLIDSFYNRTMLCCSLLSAWLNPLQDECLFNESHKP